MSIPRTLLITHYPPGMRNGSMVHVEAAIERYGDRMAWFSTKPPGTIAGRGTERGAEGLPLPWACGHVPTRGTREPWRSLRIHGVLGVWAHKLGRDAARFGRRHGVELVWGEMGLEAVVAARVAAQALGVPLAISAFDDPPALLRHFGYRAVTCRAFERNYRRTLAEARSHGVISQAMVEDYRERYGVEADVLYVGVDPEAISAPPDGVRLDEPLYIGSVGSVVSEVNWWLLIDALERLADDPDLPDVKVLHVGPLAERFHHPRVDATGWVTGEAYREALGRFDLGFVNLWFEPDFADWSRIAMPTKLTTFLEAQRPLVAFAPADSSVARWVADRGLGAVCSRPDAGALAEAIRGLLLDDARYCDTISALQTTASEISRPRYLDAVAHFLERATR